MPSLPELSSDRKTDPEEHHCLWLEPLQDFWGSVCLRNGHDHEAEPRLWAHEPLCPWLGSYDNTVAPPWGAIIAVLMSGVVTRPGTPPRPAVFPKGASGQGAQWKQDSSRRTMFFTSWYPSGCKPAASVISHIMKTKGKAQTFEPLLKVPGLKLCHQ